MCHSPIQAKIDHRLLDKVTRFFTMSLQDLFVELIQNARRSGATHIDVRQSDNGKNIVFSDNGCGIEDPQSLLALGASGWDEDTLEAEDPAGIGVFALSPFGAVIRSRASGSDSGWFVNLTPDHFTGKLPATIEPDETEEGTEIIFPHTASGAEIRHALENAARYCRVSVAFDGVWIDQEPFLKRAFHTDTWKGLCVGVLKGSGFRSETAINFHGLVVKARLPQVSMALEGGAFHVRIEVINCPQLKLVLPARKEVVQDSFFEELQVAVNRTIYRAIARIGSHRLPYRAWREAADLGVEMPETLPELFPYTPTFADDCNDCRAREFIAAETGYLVAFTGEAEAHQCFWRAVQLSKPDLALYTTRDAFKGYSWYDRLSRVTGFRCFATVGDNTTEVVLADQCGERERPDRITIEINIRTPGGEEQSLSLETDLLLSGETSSVDLDDVGLFIAKASKMTPDTLAELLEASYFAPSDDACADSYETQLEWFRDVAREIAITLLLSEKEARLDRIEEAIRRNLLWLCRRHGKTVITIDGDGIQIEQASALRDDRQIEAFPADA